MILRSAALLAAFALVACGSAKEETRPPSIAADEIVSGSTFLTADTRALQEDDFANPGFLWVDRGESLFQAAQDSTPSCASCHENGLTGVAARYPAIDEPTGKLLNLEARINQCRTEHQSLPALDYESDDLLGLTAYVAHQSRGMPLSVSVEGQAAAYFARGEDYFFTRRGQFNLSCNQCHDKAWGQKLRGDTISQGHGNGFPAYRLEWQSLGSLHRRMRDCDTGVRAEPRPFGDEDYLAVELYLAARAQGLAVETPAVRR